MMMAVLFVTCAGLCGSITEVPRSTSLASVSLGVIKTLETLAGLLVTAARHAVVDVVIAHAAFTRAARHQRVAVVVLRTPVAAYT